MNLYVQTWLYLLIAISFVYWFIVGGHKLFPTLNPLIISIMAMIIVYYMSNYQSVVLLI